MAMRPRAFRDLAAQVAAAREIGKRARIPASSKAREPGPGWQPGLEDRANFMVERQGNPVDHLARRPLYDEEELEVRLTWAKSVRGDAGPGILAELKRVQSAGPHRLLSAGGSISEILQLRADFPTFAEVLDFVWGRVRLGGLAIPPAVHLPPLLLNGPPGTGKTEFSKRLAKWLNVPIFEVDVAMLETGFRLTGLDAGYSNGKPGLIWQALQGPSMAPVMVLDELDKRPESTRDSGLSFLLGVLEPTSATRFQDAYVGLAVDASQITWVATCNDVRNIDPPVRSRFRTFDIATPSAEQMTAVVSSVFKSLRRRESWGEVFPENLPCEVATALADSSPRDVWQALEDACARAAVAGRRHLLREDVVPRQRIVAPGMGFLAAASGEANGVRRQP